MNLIALVRSQRDDFNDFDASVFGENKRILGVATQDLDNTQVDEYDNGNPSEEVKELVS